MKKQYRFLSAVIAFTISSFAYAGPCRTPSLQEITPVGTAEMTQFFIDHNLTAIIENCSEYQANQTRRMVLMAGKDAKGNPAISFQHNTLDTDEFLMCENISVDLSKPEGREACNIW